MKRLLKQVYSLVLVMALVLSSLIFVPSYSNAAIKLNKKSITVKVGKTYKLKLKGTKKSAKWSSANKAIAKVSKKGVVTGVKAGKTKITAKLGKKKYTCKVTVQDAGKTAENVVATNPPAGTDTAAPANVATGTPATQATTAPQTDAPVITEAPVTEPTAEATRTPRPTRTPAPTEEPSPAPLTLKDWNNDYQTAAYYKELSSLTTATAGKEIIITAQDDNKIYALSSDGSAVTKTDITDSMFKDGIHVRANASYESYSWDCKYNYQVTSARGYGFENMANGAYVGIVSSKLGVSKDPVGDGYDTAKSFIWTAELANGNSSSSILGYTGGAFASVSSSNNIKLYEKVETKSSTWTKVDTVKPNREYLMVNSASAGSAKMFSMNGTGNSSFEAKDVTITSSGGKLTINYTGDYNDAAVLHTYGIGSNYFWIDNWSCPDTRQTLTLYSDGSKLYISSEHCDNSYYFRFSYANNTLTAYKSFTGTDSSTLGFSGSSFNTGSGNVYFYERSR